MNAFIAALSVPWAIRSEALQQILDIASRIHEPDFEAALNRRVSRNQQIDFEAVSVSAGTPLPGTRSVRMRGNVAVLPVEGPIFRYANLFNSMSGATSIELMARDFRVALSDPDVEAILLHVDSPGGEVNGTGEFADHIFSARGKKPIWAYVSNEGASGAYWIASACDRVICAPTSIVGSIGVVAAIPDPAADNSGRVQFVSSQSPKKRPDPKSEDGKMVIQSVLDDLADQFIGAVARNRSVETDVVMSDFGAGGVMVGQKAVDAGLADAVGSFEKSLTDITRMSVASKDNVSTKASTQDSAHKEDSTQSSRTGTTAVQEKSPHSEVSEKKTSERKRSRKMGLRDRLLAAINGTPEEEFEDSTTDAHAEKAVETARPPAQTAAVASPAAVTTTVASLENQQLRERLTRVEDENRRIKAERMQEKANDFWGRLIRDGQAVPTEQAGIVRGYIQAATDDEVLPRSDGTTRVADFEAMYLARPDHMLMAEQVPSALNDLIMLRNNMTSVTTGQTKPGQPMSEERRKELLSQTDVGQQELRDRERRANGASRN